MIRVTVRLRSGLACFGFIVAPAVDGAIVTDAPPIARWALGMPARRVWDYWRRRGARVEWIP